MTIDNMGCNALIYCHFEKVG